MFCFCSRWYSLICKWWCHCFVTALLAAKYRPHRAGRKRQRRHYSWYEPHSISSCGAPHPCSSHATQGWSVRVAQTHCTQCSRASGGQGAAIQAYNLECTHQLALVLQQQQGIIRHTFDGMKTQKRTFKKHLVLPATCLLEGANSLMQNGGSRDKVTKRYLVLLCITYQHILRDVLSTVRPFGIFWQHRPAISIPVRTHKQTRHQAGCDYWRQHQFCRRAEAKCAREKDMALGQREREMGGERIKSQ